MIMIEANQGKMVFVQRPAVDSVMLYEHLHQHFHRPGDAARHQIPFAKRIAHSQRQQDHHQVHNDQGCNRVGQVKWANNRQGKKRRCG